ncbi:MAG: error-prone DNA polymerase [Acidimicrobiaceae bacterium]|nr:error-prone DNA polymerase [Acidimicrobiia bacterium]MCY4493456.1 error-prone DNA polymerase [Acidimicrobiaceae bacterium]
MSWQYFNAPWKDLESVLSGRHAPLPHPPAPPAPAVPARPRRQGSVRYAELHCHSNFSFLDGASHPEELVDEAARIGLEALALTDHNGFYGIVRFAEAARAVGLRTVFGAELTLAPEESLARQSPPEQPPAPEESLARQSPAEQPPAPEESLARQSPPEESLARQSPAEQSSARGSRRGSRRQSSAGSANLTRTGPADPKGRHLLVLARDPRGYALLARAISEGQLAGSKNAPRIDYQRLVELGGAGTGDHWVVLSGCRKGAVPAALVNEGPAAAARALERLVADFGRPNVVVELWDHGLPIDSVRNDGLAALAVSHRLKLIASGNVHHHSVARQRLAAAMAAVRARRSLDEIDGWLPPAGRHLRSGAEQAARFARYPGVVSEAATLGIECAFDLKLIAPNLPPFPCPDGLDEMGYLRRLVDQGGTGRYGPRSAERVPGAWAQLDKELGLIEQLGFPGYFLVVHDIVEFCRRSRILCQGRGSAANSAVCFALGVTNADAVSLGLLFERFLSPEREGPPDIDIDIESDRREEVIQYVYARHGRHHAAQVANVISYRSKSAIRDMAKALGYTPGQQDSFSKQVDRWRHIRLNEAQRDTVIPTPVLELAAEIEHFPRHLGIHSGGMVMCDRPVIEVCPVEWGQMADRSVLQWDKDDCASAGLVKFDLLGLGMLSALRYAIDLIAEHDGQEIDLALLPQDDQVYEMLQKADTIGVFQVESRAQMATLPRLKPRCFYDLVVEVALIRPGPIQGGSVHPYIRRRNGHEAVTYLHPLLKNALAKTLGIPLFQEQLMQIAIDVAGFTASEADQLRQAIGSKRSRERMERLKERFFAGMRERGISDDIGEQIWLKLAAFANYGFPESHSVSFSYLVYASAWIKYHYPAAFCASLLNAQPMGFWSPHTLVGDARRHGVVVNTVDLNASAAEAVLEPDRTSTGGWAVRLGLGSVRGVGEDLAEQIDAGRPYTSVEDLRRRVPKVPLRVLEVLATAGAFGCFGIDRRSALWTAGAMSQTAADRLPGIVTGDTAPSLPRMSPAELSHSDLWATGIAPDGHPTVFVRSELDESGVVTAAGLDDRSDGERVLVGGVVTHRQRPPTAGGVTFLSLEDETGLINVVVSSGCWQRYRNTALGASALLIRGRLEKAEGAVNVVADKLQPLTVGSAPASRDFR